jgi:CubicO group peptidase (beta-lactamase class C family)
MDRRHVARAVGISLFVLAGCTGRAAPVTDGNASLPAPSGESPDRYRTPRTLDDGWMTASLESAGIDRRRLEQMTDAIRQNTDWNVHAVLIERDGRLVYEEYFVGWDQRWGRSLGQVAFDRQTRHDLRSVSKSVISALVGIALGSGAIRSVDEPILAFFPDYADLTDPERKRVTLRHALTMSAGLDWNERLPYTDPRNDEIQMTWSRDPIRYVLSRPIVMEPGQTWNYNGGLTQLLAAVVQRSTKQKVQAYAQGALFEPLGIVDVEWVGDLDGMPSAASGLRLRPRDLAKIGSVYLHDGRWRERQVVPAAWVRESTRRHLPVPAPAGRAVTVGYGYQWWHLCLQTAHGTVESATAMGNGEQRIYVLPALRTVVTVLAGRYNDRSLALGSMLLVEHIIPAALAGDGGGRSEPPGCRAA